MQAENVAVTNNEAENRFEATVDGHTSLLAYRRTGRAIAFTHTEVPEQLGGQGIGGKLAQAGLEYARAQGVLVIPFCSFVAGYIRRHPEYADLVAPEHRKLIQHPME